MFSFWNPATAAMMRSASLALSDMYASVATVRLDEMMKPLRSSSACRVSRGKRSRIAAGRVARGAYQSGHRPGAFAVIALCCRDIGGRRIRLWARTPLEQNIDQRRRIAAAFAELRGQTADDAQGGLCPFQIACQPEQIVGGTAGQCAGRPADRHLARRCQQRRIGHAAFGQNPYVAGSRARAACSRPARRSGHRSGRSRRASHSSHRRSRPRRHATRKASVPRHPRSRPVWSIASTTSWPTKSVPRSSMASSSV